jgi:hypothetical protein
MSTGPALDARFAVSHPQLLSRDIKLLRSFSSPPFGGRRQKLLFKQGTCFPLTRTNVIFTVFKSLSIFFFDVAYSVVTSSAGWSGFDFRRRQKSFCFPKGPNRGRGLHSVLCNGTGDFTPVTATIHLTLALLLRKSGVITYLHSSIHLHVVSKHRDNFYGCVIDQAIIRWLSSPRRLVFDTRRVHR